MLLQMILYLYPLVCLDNLCWITADETRIYYSRFFLFIMVFLLYICHCFFFLGVTLCIQRYKCHWFLIDSGSRNPYKLVYKVFKFAKDHTYPTYRSAFTYCEDELPSRLDLGKENLWYGLREHFTTEQMVDVKVFLGILRILLTPGPVMMVDFSMGGILSKSSSHFDKFSSLYIIVMKSQCLKLTPSLHYW